MKQLPAGTVVQIRGFSDSTGNPAVNMKLSQVRANAVRQVLVNAGVNPAKLVATGYGSSVSAVSENGTTEGRSSSTVGVREGEARRISHSPAIERRRRAKHINAGVEYAQIHATFGPKLFTRRDFPRSIELSLAESKCIRDAMQAQLAQARTAGDIVIIARNVCTAARGAPSKTGAVAN